MKKINLLFSSVGKRVELVNAFREAKNIMNIDGNLIGCDMDKSAPALRFVDKAYKVVKICDDNFINQIIDICKKEEISLIIPTLDTELLVYAKNKEKIESESGAKVMISDEEMITIMRDKKLTCEFLRKNSIKVPKVIKEINDNNIQFPLFIKPLDGSSGINNFKINNREELIFFSKYVKNPIIQEFVEGNEYCVDIFCDFNGNPITITPKLRIAHSSGEITKAKVIKDREIIELGKKIAEIFKPVGEINFDCMKNDNGVFVIEINGRFAGGAPISFKAGSNSPMRIYEILLGKEVNYNENFKDGFIALRFGDAVYINDGEL